MTEPQKPQEPLNHPDGETFIVRVEKFIHGLMDGTTAEFKRGEEIVLKLAEDVRDDYVKVKQWLFPKDALPQHLQGNTTAENTPPPGPALATGSASPVRNAEPGAANPVNAEPAVGVTESTKKADDTERPEGSDNPANA